MNKTEIEITEISNSKNNELISRIDEFDMNNFLAWNNLKAILTIIKFEHLKILDDDENKKISDQCCNKCY